MDNKRKLFILTIFLLLTPILIYFKYSPTILNDYATNLFIICLVTTFVALLVYYSVSKRIEVNLWWILFPTLIFIFLIRAIPNLFLLTMPLPDSYYYLVSFINIVKTGTVNPVLTWWYPLISQQLHWPLLLIYSANLFYLSNISPINISKFISPFIGVLYFLATFILAKLISNDNKTSFLTALIASTSGAVVYYQAEFHPQALAGLLLIFVFMFYIRFKQFDKNKLLFGILMILSILLFSLNHHFSSLFIALIAIIYLSIILLFGLLKTIWGRYDDVYNYLSKDFNLWIFIAISMLTYHLFIYINFVRGLVSPILERSPEFTLVTIGPQVPYYVTVLNSTKWILFILAIPSIFLILRNYKKHMNQFRFLILFVCFLLAGLLASFVVSIPLDRIIYYTIPFLAFFAALTVVKLCENSSGFSFTKDHLLKVLLVLMLILPITCGIFASQTPAYFFKGTEINSYYYYANNPTIVNSFEDTGAWINKYTNSKKYATEFNTIVPLFYYGQKGTFTWYREGIPDIYKGVFVLSPYLPNDDPNFNKKEFLDRNNVYYNNGMIVVGET